MKICEPKDRFIKIRNAMTPDIKIKTSDNLNINMNCLQQVDTNFQKFTTNYFDNKNRLNFHLTMFTQIRQIVLFWTRVYITIKP